MMTVALVSVSWSCIIVEIQSILGQILEQFLASMLIIYIQQALTVYCITPETQHFQDLYMAIDANDTIKSACMSITY